MNKIGIIILSFNVKDDLLDCLQSLQELTISNDQVMTIVVDNHSIDDSAALVKKSFPKIKLIENSENIGFSAANNLGIKYALENGADYIFLLNPDTLVSKNLISELVEAMSKDSQVGVLSPKIYFAPGFEFHKDKYQKKDLGKVFWYAGGIVDWKNVLPSHRGVDEIDHGQYDTIEETDFVSGCAMFIRKDVFKKIGFLDERYFLYFEDLDFCQRAKKKGLKVVYVPTQAVWHKNARSSAVGSITQDYYTTRNRLLFGLTYANLRAKLALLKESLKFLLTASVARRKGVIDFYLRKFGKGNF